MRCRKTKTHNPAQDLLALIEKTDISNQREKLALFRAMYLYVERWFIAFSDKEVVSSFITSHFIALLGPKEILETILLMLICIGILLRL